MQIRKFKPGAHVELVCKHFVAEGLGLSYFADEAQKEKFKPQVFFIWGVLPGERFIARLGQVKSRHAHGILAVREDLSADYAEHAFVHDRLALLDASADRVEAACEIFLRCGGCRLQQMTYAQTLGYKIEWLTTQLKHNKLEVPDIEQHSSSDAERSHYRNHVQVHINKFGTYGFYEPFSYRTRAFPEHGCLIFQEKNLRSEFPKFPVEVRAARVRINQDGRAQYSILNAKTEATQLMQYDVAWPAGQMTSIYFPMNSFFQVNLRILPAWLDFMSECLQGGTSGWLRVLELFSGFGFISRMLSQMHDLEILAADLISVDQVKSVRIEQNGVALSEDFYKNYVKADLFLPEKISAEFLTRIGDFNPQLLLINPPRAGLSPETWARLRENALSDFQGPILYSSCNAATMARDMAYLQTEGYRITRMRMFDFFPWTHHFETVAYLVRD
jgi:23S rRNA (uracil1939-C5)-methyltransferase